MPGMGLKNEKSTSTADEIEPVPSCNQTWQNAHPPFSLYSSIMFEDTHGTPVEITPTECNAI